MTQQSTAALVDRALREGGIQVVSVSIGRRNDKSTWRVQPAELQQAAQPLIDAFDRDAAAVEAPLVIDGREFWRRFTTPERHAVRAAARANDTVADMVDELQMGSVVNVHDPRVVAGLRSLKAVLVPGVWADDATAEARIAVLADL